MLHDKSLEGQAKAYSYTCRSVAHGKDLMVCGAAWWLWEAVAMGAEMLSYVYRHTHSLFLSTHLHAVSAAVSAWLHVPCARACPSHGPSDPPPTHSMRPAWGRHGDRHSCGCHRMAGLRGWCMDACCSPPWRLPCAAACMHPKATHHTTPQHTESASHHSAWNDPCMTSTRAFLWHGHHQSSPSTLTCAGPVTHMYMSSKGGSCCDNASLRKSSVRMCAGSRSSHDWSADGLASLW